MPPGRFPEAMKEEIILARLLEKTVFRFARVVTSGDIPDRGFCALVFEVWVIVAILFVIVDVAKYVIEEVF
jgi:hypothetical protein